MGTERGLRRPATKDHVGMIFLGGFVLVLCTVCP